MKKKTIDEKVTEAEIKLAHGAVIVMQFRDDDLIDKLKVYTGGKALLRTKEDSVVAFPKGFPQCFSFGKCCSTGDNE